MWLFHLSDKQRSRPPGLAAVGHPWPARHLGSCPAVLPIGFRRIGPGYIVARLGKDYGHSLRRAPRIRANAAETRLMGNAKTGSHLPQ